MIGGDAGALDLETGGGQGHGQGQKDLEDHVHDPGPEDLGPGRDPGGLYSIYQYFDVGPSLSKSKLAVSGKNLCLL